MIKRKVAQETGTNAKDWDFIDGPTTGVGVEYWLRHKTGLEAYVCDDQGEIKITIQEVVNGN